MTEQLAMCVFVWRPNPPFLSIQFLNLLNPFWGNGILEVTQLMAKGGVLREQYGSLLQGHTITQSHAHPGAI